MFARLCSDPKQYDDEDFAGGYEMQQTGRTVQLAAGQGRDWTRAAQKNKRTNHNKKRKIEFPPSFPPSLSP